MNKKSIATALTILIIIGFVGIIVLQAQSNGPETQVPEIETRTTQEPNEIDTYIPTSQEPSEGEENTTEGEVISAKAQATYYYGVTCPYCTDVEEYIEENNLEDFIDIEKKEIYENRRNLLELQKVARDCGLDPNAIAVPFLASDAGCFVGLYDTIDELDRLAESAE